MGKDTTIIVSLILFNVFFLAFIGGIIIFIREYRIKKKAHAEELETVDILHKQELLKTQTEIQQETMKYIGREIHDNVGQKLTLSSMYLQQLTYENKAPQIAESINTITDIINESLNDLRHLSKSLTSDTIENNTLSELIEEECIKIHDLKTHTITFKNKLQSSVNSYQIKSILLRIVQEFIQNSIKHAQCKNVEIVLSNLKNELQFILKDDGKGFDVTIIKSKGIGLRNIKKRIEILKGSFTLQSNTNGTTLIIKIPL